MACLGTLTLCLNVKPKCLCSGKHPDPVYLWVAAEKRKLTHPLPEAGHSRRYLQGLWPFYFTCSPPPPLCSVKETGIQIKIMWFLGDPCPPSSRSAGFLNKVVTPCLKKKKKKSNTGLQFQEPLWRLIYFLKLH